MQLIIVESPTKSKTLSRFLEKDYKILSSYGHVRDLPQKEMGVDIENNFKPKYVIPQKSKKVIKELKDAIKKADSVILATDEDREGEAIAWHITEALKTKKDDISSKYQRITFHEITKTAIQKALKEPRQIDMNLVNAQQARRILDRLVGYELSPKQKKKLIKGLSAGRVQSVAARLIVDKEREIEAFKPEEYWSIEAELKQEKDSKNNSFLAKLVEKDNKKITKLGIKNKKEAEKIKKDLENAEYKVKKVETKETQKHPLPPFTTSTLQQEAAKKLGFSSKQTMTLAQKLYEGISLGDKGTIGLITYHRTDSLNLSSQAITSARNYISKEIGNKYLPEQAKAYKTKSKGAQEAHEAIRPTKAEFHPDKIKKHLNPNQYKLYNLIWRKFVACQMKSAILNSGLIEIQAENYTFKATGSTIKFDGFLKIYNTKLKENELPSLNQGELLDLIELKSEQHFTQPPARYSDATLVKILEEYGIGRPSTYASIISTIQDRGYVQKNEQKKFFPKEIGFIVVDLLKQHFPKIVDVEFTAKMEKELDKIAQSKENWTDVIKGFYEPFHENLLEKYEKVEKQQLDQPTDKKCPKCGSPMVIKLSRFGRFYSCSDFPKCKHAEPIIKPTGVKCPECKKGNIIERKTKKGKIFYSCSRYPKCEFALWDKPINENCPKCKSLLVEKNNKIKCSNKECDYIKSK